MKPIALLLSLATLLCLFTGCSSAAGEDLAVRLDAIQSHLDSIEASLSKPEATAAPESAAAETSYNTDDSPREAAAKSFTNAYGTASTLCAHSGCSNTIASSGDTNCCTIHSNRCLECNCYIDEDAMYCMDCLTGAITGNDDASFSNAYGSTTTKCAHSGCSNTVASSGDTNCCTIHSNRCLECNCYIDEDAMYCMDCLTGAITGNDDDDYSYSHSQSDSHHDDYSYDYDMPEVGESFSDYVQRVDPDLYADMEDILNSLY